MISRSSEGVAKALPCSVFSRSAWSSGAPSVRAMSVVMPAPPSAMASVWMKCPSENTESVVVPAPKSMQATPSLASSGVITASALA